MLSAVLVLSLALLIPLYLYTFPAFLPEPSLLRNVKRPASIEPINITGGESLLKFGDGIVTGDISGHLVSFNPTTLAVQWRVRCPGQCRILGLREHRGELIGVNQHGNLFRFSEGVFHWLTDLETFEERPGFLNDLVIVGDMVYFTDSFYRRDAGLSMLQRFYSLRPEGRILSYNLTDGRSGVLARGLTTPNGIEVAGPGNHTLLVSEGALYRVSLISLSTGEHLGTFPGPSYGAVDNVRRTGGHLWFGLSTGRTGRANLAEVLSLLPGLRELITGQPLLRSIFPLYTRLFAEPPRVYRTDVEGEVGLVVEGKEGVAWSQVLEWDEDTLFIGAPFTPVLRVKRL